MSKRSERREAERQSRKSAYIALRQQRAQSADILSPISPNTEMKTESPLSSPQPTNPAPISQKQLRANRANSEHSTGPITPQGKAASSRNALKTALTGQTVLLPTDNAVEYEARLADALHLHRPETDDETTLVHSLVDTAWRLKRIVNLETGIYLKGAIEFAGSFNDHPSAQRNTLIQTETYLKYEKSLRNLNIQESRLQRQRTKNLAELKRLQQDRIRQDRDLATAAPDRAIPLADCPNGFEFSNFAADPKAPSEAPAMPQDKDPETDSVPANG